jgi:hypothetical protein
MELEEATELRLKVRPVDGPYDVQRVRSPTTPRSIGRRPNVKLFIPSMFLFTRIQEF